MSARTRRRDPAPLSIAQLGAVAASAARELAWGLRIVRATVAEWQARAGAIPDPTARTYALAALADKRPLLDGAGLFWILPVRRHPELLKLLVTFQILANFHDHAGERVRGAGAPGSAESISALGRILDIEQSWRGYDGRSRSIDGGYLNDLADGLRSMSVRLPHYEVARPLLIQQAQRAHVMDIEHRGGPDVADRIRCFASTYLVDPGRQFAWWEAAAGAGSLLSALAVLAVSADEHATEEELRRTVEAYISVEVAATLLDHYIDQADDELTGAHNYMNYYRGREAAEARLGDLIRQALCKVGQLRRGERHLVVVSSMTAMYLTSDSSQSAGLRTSSEKLVGCGGSLTRLLVPLLRAWRIAYREFDA